jgi:hypothetical protein
MQICGGCAGDAGNQDWGDGQEGRDKSLEKAGGPADGESIGDLVAEPPPAGELASLGDKVAEGAADRRGDGLLVDERDLGAGLEEALLFVLGGRLVVVGHGDGGGGRLHHGEDGEDIGERVLGLVGRSAKLSAGARGKRTSVIASIDATNVTNRMAAPHAGICTWSSSCARLTKAGTCSAARRAMCWIIAVITKGTRVEKY